MSQPRGISTGARGAYDRSPTSASGAIGAIASGVTVLTATFPPCARHQLLAQIPAPDDSTVDPSRAAWKGRRAILYFRALDSVLSDRKRPSKGARAAQILGKREQHVTASVAFVTKSYAPDLKRCELLCRSIELLAPATRHWIIVDSRDLAAFSGLENERTRIVTTEELLPRRIRRLEVYGIGKNIWLGARTRPMRGWLVQQLAKLAITSVADDDVLIHADSDVVLIRPFREAALTDAGGSLRLFRIPAAIDEGLPDHVGWHRTAERLLGIPARPLPLPDYVGGLIPWRREVVVSLLEEIETRSGRNWMRTLASARHVSEYILYGRFVEDALDRSNGRPGASLSLCRCYWGSEPLTTPELRDFHRGGVSGGGRGHDLCKGRNEAGRLCRRHRTAVVGTFEERFVDAQISRRLMTPGELPFHSLSTQSAHLGATFRVVE